MNVVLFPGMVISFRPTASFTPQQRVRRYDALPLYVGIAHTYLSLKVLIRTYFRSLLLGFGQICSKNAVIQKW